MFEVVVLLPNGTPHVSKALPGGEVSMYGARMFQIYKGCRISIRVFKG